VTSVGSAAEAGEAVLLSVDSLTVDFYTRQGRFTPVNAISFDVRRGRVLGIVGESGSGKSMTALSLMQLLPPGAARIASGQIRFGGGDLRQRSERQMQAIRGREIAMIFQDPMTSLNPIFSIGHQLREPLCLHLGLGRAAADERASELLALVRIADPRACLKKYPHELSGGMRQRVMIAIAISCNPKLLIADEPTTALDVTTQAQILDLLRDLKDRLDMSVILITHDLGVVADFADEVAVMYAGRIVERASVAEIFSRPRHPYTQGLLHSMPSLEEADPERLPTIEGVVASPFALPEGCAFHPRCSHAWATCREAVPPFRKIAADHDSACLLP
jgi:oligopeptide/dipeptide ABC transporter ATP-binding protein